MALFKITNELSKIIGSSSITKREGLKKVWQYIKENHLQNPLNKKEILVNQELKDVFHQEKVQFTEVTKLLKPHYEHIDESVPVLKKPRQKKAPEKTPVNFKRVKPSGMRLVRVKPAVKKSTIKKKKDNVAAEDPSIVKEQVDFSEPLKEAITIVLKSVLG